MAVFRATFAEADNQQPTTYQPGAGNPVLLANTMEGLDELTTSGTAGNVQNASSEWSAGRSGYVTMVCTGAVWVAVGSSPTAAVATGLFLKADERVVLAVRNGDKISVIDDS